jgi:hypothetical protein
MSFDSVPIWAVLVATIGLVYLSIEIGIRLGRRRLLRSAGKLEVSGALVGATMGLLAFMLAFTFNGAANSSRATLSSRSRTLASSSRNTPTKASPAGDRLRCAIRTDRPVSFGPEL